MPSQARDVVTTSDLDWDRATYRVVFALTVAYIVLALGVSPILVGFVGYRLHLAGAVLFVAGVAYGLPAVAAVVLGTVGASLFGGTLTAHTGFLLLSNALFVLVGVQFLRQDDGPVGRVKTAIPTVLVVGVVASALAAAITAWGADILFLSPFAVTVVGEFIARVVPALLISFVGVVVLSYVTDAGDGSTRLNRSEFKWVALLSIVWTGGGYFLSSVYQTLELTYTQALINRVGFVVVPFQRVGGPGGQYVLAVFGLAVLTTVLWLLGREFDRDTVNG